MRAGVMKTIAQALANIPPFLRRIGDIADGIFLKLHRMTETRSAFHGAYFARCEARARPKASRMSDTTRVVCAWCGDIRDGTGRWQHLSAQSPHVHRVSHGICAACADGLRAQLRR